ncbi:MAG: hypothetical protein H6579_10560 [Chitinophagales bacterium]|nr:hypothetical protein [Bacteroidota bacterium]MCB9257563.1 hypothetical protein [Chitinophagales bacterium]
MKTFIAIVFALLIGFGAFVFYASYSEGVRSGVLMKISKRGYIFKTHEGQLNIGGFDQTNDVGVSNVWEFSVTDELVLEQLEDAMDHSQRVKLYYKEKYIKLPWRGDTKYFVYDVETLGQY